MPVAINDAIENEESMLLSQLSFLNEQLRTANGLPLHIRANCGVGNLPSMFGCGTLSDAARNQYFAQRAPFAWRLGSH